MKIAVGLSLRTNIKDSRSTFWFAPTNNGRKRVPVMASVQAMAKGPELSPVSGTDFSSPNSSSVALARAQSYLAPL